MVLNALIMSTKLKESFKLIKRLNASEDVLINAYGRRVNSNRKKALEFEVLTIESKINPTEYWRETI